MGCAADSSRTWLSEIASIFAALQTCPTMVRCVRAAHKSSACRPNRADFIEADVLRRLSSRANTATLSRELLSKAVQLVDLPPIVGVRVEVVKRERYPLDCWFVFQHDSSETRIPVNVKTAALTNEKTYRSRAVALAPLLSWISDPNGRIDFIARDLDADQMILELIYGARKIVPGRDYYLFEIDLRNGGLSFRSLIARHRPDGSGLALERHQSRDVVNYLPCGDVILPNFDIAQSLGYALLPRPSVSRMKTQILAVNLAQEKATL